MKLLYLGIKNTSKNGLCLLEIGDYRLTILQLAIFFEGRIDKYLKM